MKKILIILLLASCHNEEPTYPVGTWSFEAESFSGKFTINSQGFGTADFTLSGKHYSAMNVDIRQGSSIIMYSEDDAFVGLYQITYTNKQFVSKTQEYRDCCLPTPFSNSKRAEELLITP